MRWFAILACSLLCFIALAEGPRALLLEGNTLLPARAAAGWLGAEITADAQGNVTLVRGETTFRAAFTRRAATVNGKEVVLPAPALRYQDTGYLPARSLAEAFGAKLAWDGKAAVLTVAREGATPLALPATPLPRPACLADETLAGLTIGDHLAQAVLRWGDPSNVAKSSLPGAQDYTFDADNAKSIEIIVTVRGDEIIMVEVSLVGEKPPSPALLKATGAKGGLNLASKQYPPSYTNTLLWTNADYSGDRMLAALQRGKLLVINYFGFGESDAKLDLWGIALVRRDFSKAWLLSKYGCEGTP